MCELTEKAPGRDALLHHSLEQKPLSSFIL